MIKSKIKDFIKSIGNKWSENTFSGRLELSLEEFIRLNTNASDLSSPEALKKKIDTLSGRELFELSKIDTDFLQHLATTGLVLDALQKMSYNQTKELCQKAHPIMSSDVRKQAQNIVRNKRERVRV